MDHIILQCFFKFLLCFPFFSYQCCSITEFICWTQRVLVQRLDRRSNERGPTLKLGMLRYLSCPLFYVHSSEIVTQYDFDLLYFLYPGFVFIKVDIPEKPGYLPFD